VKLFPNFTRHHLITHTNFINDFIPTQLEPAVAEQALFVSPFSGERSTKRA